MSDGDESMSLDQVHIVDDDSDEDDFEPSFIIGQLTIEQAFNDRLLQECFRRAIDDSENESECWRSDNKNRTMIQLVNRRWSLVTKSMCKHLALSRHNMNRYVNLFPTVFNEVTTLEVVSTGDTSLSSSNDIATTVATMLRALTKQTSLSCLDLSMNELSFDNVDTIMGAIKDNNIVLSKKLTKLNLQSNPLGNDGISALCSIFRAPYTSCITELNLQSCDAVDGLELIGEIISKCPTLTTLDWSYNRSDYTSMMALSNGLRATNNIRTLYLKGCDVEGWGALSIGDTLKLNQSLTHIDLSDNFFGDRGINNISTPLVENHSLTHLDVSGNSISVDGFNSIFKSLELNPPLRYLDLSRNSIDSLNLNNLTEAFSKNTTLETLVMSECGLQNHHLDLISMGLKKSRSLTHLDISKNHISIVHPVLAILTSNRSLLHLNLSRCHFDYNSVYIMLHFLCRVPFQLLDQAQGQVTHQVNNVVHGLKYVNLTSRSSYSSANYTNLNRIIKQSQSPMLRVKL
ncbi:hypothetical protein SAMD00019534_094490 [Acytostelium subglobosum LB1]|uniref:hypothetical protein n=1 Tax=Acytostelium subglobosum LB1 TaxID=1410327 RepID=UPI0006450A95|nr:hypothetical protein SAMD00019534_094490 [Acytostelium subglobosum LB1]GAM26274.1 hypothetical protein SAMD00019534_094490 [Acytostelium subglobosum LB1]|eukprot:XP_012750828.1 hypothetical protein SAMD00019534_094490 [Acytostelium subglobosum LB1]